MAAFFVTVIVTSNKVEVNSIDAIHHCCVPVFCLDWLNLFRGSFESLLWQISLKTLANIFFTRS